MEEEIVEVRCVLGVDCKKSTEKVLAFNEEKLKICRDKQEIRNKNRKKSSKYDNVTLPEQPDGIVGYHSSCYRYFCSSVKNQKSECPAISSTSIVPVDSNLEHGIGSHTDMNCDVTNDAPNGWEDIIDMTICVFCDRGVRKVKGRRELIRKSKLTSKTQAILNVLSLANMVEKINQLQTASSISYHSTCLSEYEYKLLEFRSQKKTTSKSNTDWADRRSVHSITFAKIQKHINDTLIDKNEISALASIYELYEAIFEEEKLKSNVNLYDAKFLKHHLLKRMLESFPALTKTVYKNQTFLHKRDLPLDVIYARGFNEPGNWTARIKAVAYHIRQKVKSIEKRTLPKHNIKVQDILDGECEVPSELYLLIASLLNGPTESARKEKKIKCISDSIIYSISNGAIKPATSLQLGLVAKSITGSRKVIEILNRMGHCINYTLVTELETELAYGNSLGKKLLPHGLIGNSPGLRTHLAFDNFDRYVETIDGKDTLHDTVGIIFQNVDKSSSNEETAINYDSDSAESTAEEQSVLRRRKYYSQYDTSVQPYLRGNRIGPCLKGTEPEIPQSLETAHNMNSLWMLFHALNINGAKRWFAWNSERVIDTNPIQKIGYLPTINMSPTSDAVIKKTLEIAQTVAKECNQQNIIVTYDLAIASKAYKIKADLFPAFHNVFVTLGTFHIQLSYFKALGKFIDSSGLPKLMVESGMIAEGSLRGVLGGTHFNRCKKIHSATALSLKILHFREFFTQPGNSTLGEIEEILTNYSRNTKARDTAFFELEELLQQYDVYTKATLNGEHGQTAEYAMLYVWLIELYQLLEQAIRTSDLELYIHAAYNMCSLFFAYNHQNYARWLSRNVDDLLNIDTTHPGLRDEFANGALSIRRTKRNFCRSPIDLTLEQTINSNAANKLTGISAFTNSIGARQRWSETHTARTAIITELLEFLNLTKLEESTETEYRSRIFKKQVTRFIEEVTNNINPFSKDLNPSKLFNLSTGKAASPETAQFLLSSYKDGMKQMKVFINECKLDQNRFDRPLKKNVLKNFTVEIFKNKNSTFKNIDQMKHERNILGQVLCLALKKEIDLHSLFSYPLTSIPHSLSHFDGSMISTSKKGELTTILTSKMGGQDTSNSIDFEVDIIDGFYLLNNFRESPTKYGHFSTFLLKRICNTTALEIHIIFDKREASSPRDVAIKKHKDLYDSFSVNFSIKGVNQERNVSLAKCLANNSFREELIKFIISHWSDKQVSGSILINKRVFLSFGSKCYVFGNESEERKTFPSFENGKPLSSFENNHFEVESKIILHMEKIRGTKIRVQTPNLDTVLVYLIYHMQFWQQEKEVWIETGDLQKHTIRQINVRKIFSALTPIMVNALPSWYIFTGCEYEPSFYAKGRKTCMKALEKNIPVQCAFGRMGNGDTLNDSEIAVISKFTCDLYGLSECNNLNQARTTIFQKGYDGSDFNKKGVDFKNMPPCQKVLLNKIIRTGYLVEMIKNASCNHLKEADKGWISDENGYLEIDYFSGNPYPESIANITFNNQEEESEDEECAYNSSSDDESDDMDESDDEWEPKNT